MAAQRASGSRQLTTSDLRSKRLGEVANATRQDNDRLWDVSGRLIEEQNKVLKDILEALKDRSSGGGFRMPRPRFNLRRFVRRMRLRMRRMRARMSRMFNRMRGLLRSAGARMRAAVQAARVGASAASRVAGTGASRAASAVSRIAPYVGGAARVVGGKLLPGIGTAMTAYDIYQVWRNWFDLPPEERERIIREGVEAMRAAPSQMGTTEGETAEERGVRESQQEQERRVADTARALIEAQTAYDRAPTPLNRRRLENARSRHEEYLRNSPTPPQVIEVHPRDGDELRSSFIGVDAALTESGRDYSALFMLLNNNEMESIVFESDKIIFDGEFEGLAIDSVRSLLTPTSFNADFTAPGPRTAPTSPVSVSRDAVAAAMPTATSPGTRISPGSVSLDRPRNVPTGSGSAQEAIEFFVSKGWTREQAVGLAANLQVESDFNPGVRGDNDQAYGIAQWHPPRQRNFQAWSGRPIVGSSFREQLEFIHHELTQGDERRAGAILRLANTPEEAAAVVDQYYERSSGAARQRRIGLASEYMRQFSAQGTAQQPAPTTGQAVSAAGTEAAVGDQARQMSGARQTTVVVPQSQAPSMPTTRTGPTSAGEVSFNVRLQRQVAA